MGEKLNGWMLLGHVLVFPVTFVGLILCLFGGVRFYRVDPRSYALVFIATDRTMKPTFRWFFDTFEFVAITLGSVIVFRDQTWAMNLPTIKHENRHLMQMMVFPFGLQPILYVLFSVVISAWRLCDGDSLKLAWRTGYHENPFERDARRYAGQEV